MEECLELDCTRLSSARIASINEIRIAGIAIPKPTLRSKCTIQDYSELLSRSEISH